jgi:hypothetical protein
MYQNILDPNLFAVPQPVLTIIPEDWDSQAYRELNRFKNENYGKTVL